jgi:Cu/Ag efflux pump CusA
MELDISGEELQPLFEVGLKAFLKARDVLGDPQILPDPPSLTLGQPFIEGRPDWERAAELGLAADELGYLVWALADGAYHDDFYLGDRKIDLFLYGSAQPPRRPADLAALPLYTERGGIVPLSALVRLRETVAADTIRRLNGQRTVTLNIVSPTDMPLETAVHKVQTEVVGALRAAGEVPDGVHIAIGGASDKLASTRAALADNMLLALALVYLIMAAILRHWGYPLVIMLTVPLGYAGGVIGLRLMNAVGISASFDMITVLGFLVLIGVVVNNRALPGKPGGRGGAGAGPARRRSNTPAADHDDDPDHAVWPVPAGVPAARGYRAVPWPRHRAAVRPAVLHPGDADLHALPAALPAVRSGRLSAGRSHPGFRSCPGSADNKHLFCQPAAA